MCFIWDFLHQDRRLFLVFENPQIMCTFKNERWGISQLSLALICQHFRLNLRFLTLALRKGSVLSFFIFLESNGKYITTFELKNI